jgi:hypothetical protein
MSTVIGISAKAMNSLELTWNISVLILIVASSSLAHNVQSMSDTVIWLLDFNKPAAIAKS